MPAAAPPRKGMHPVVIALLVLVGLFVLAVVGVIGTGIYFAHKIKNNPGAFIARMVTMGNPNVDVVSTDDAAQTITLRDKSTGKVVTMNFNDIKNGGKISFTADDDKGGTATMQFGGDAKPNLPSWVPNYPGSTPKATFSVTGNSSEGTGGNYSFTTSDSASKVTEFYQDKMKAAGLEIKSTTTTPMGTSVAASDSSERKTLVALIGEANGETTVNITYGEKK